VGNIPRVVPKNMDVVLDSESWPIPPIFKFLQKHGPVEEQEMYRVFNMGIGFVMIVAKDFADAVMQKLTKYGETVYKIGAIAPGKNRVIIK
jgi:phosphoribosylformylglycinamidine cyclo-ligase